MSFPIQLVETPDALARLVAALGRPARIAVDTEAASYHKYSDGVCLVQLSTADLTAVVDVVKCPDLAPLGRLLATVGIESVFHDADYDLRLLDRDHRIGITGLFDTRIAAQLLGEPGIGLAALLEKYAGVKLDKKFQRADWSRRPMEPGMLEYAAADTHYLLALRDTLDAKLVALGRRHWAAEEFGLAATARWDKVPNEEAYLKVKGARLLKPRQLAVLRELHAWREEVAKGLDRATFRVMNPETLLLLAELQPRDLAAMRGMKGISPDQVERRGRELVAAIERGLALPEQELPRLERTRRPPPDPAFDARMERLKVVRNAAAERLGLQPGVLCPNGILEGIARVEPKSVDEMAKVEEMRRWQREALGTELLGAIPGTP
jgi:ribonuclease D